VLAAVGITPEEAAPIAFFKGRGCRACHGRGYLGRHGVFEVMALDEALKLLVMRGASEQDLEQEARRRGMRRLRESALEAVRGGITTPEEMGRVVLTKQVC
jgi:type II secretory ATPase GspE/PulE/Tfp pilus assembly ATPase PilB-like protein